MPRRKNRKDLEKQKINKVLAITFVTVMGILALPLVTASATGHIVVFDGKLGVLSILAFFTASYAIIVIHALLGRD